ncbi:MAG: InlB B-repeat-containing protein [Treponema sp.]|nr:InlB B-repeat-containing protein [Treponema sp.]
MRYFFAALAVLAGCNNPSGTEKDRTAPVLSAGSVSAYENTVAGTTAAVHFTSNEAGTYYVVVYQGAATPPADGAAVEAAFKGGVTGSTKARDTGSATANTAVNASLTGLTKDTAYQAHVTVKDGAGNYSDVWSSGVFTPTEGAHYTLTYDYEGADGGTSETTASVTKDYPYVLTAAPTRTGYDFAGWYTGDNGTGTQLTGANGESLSAWPSASGATVYAGWILTANTYAVGTTGPAGGLICWKDETGYAYEGVVYHYLEAAPPPAGGETEYQWGGCEVVCADTGTAIGTGAANTVYLAAHDHDEVVWGSHVHDAARACADYSVVHNTVTYDDWFLPSKDELALMYTHLKAAGLGGFSIKYYWSSSQATDTNDYRSAFIQNFSSGASSYTLKDHAYVDAASAKDISVRPMRAF